MTDTRREPAPGPGDAPDAGPWQAPGSDAGPAGLEWSSPDAGLAQSTDAGAGSVPVSPSFSSHATSGPRLTYDPATYGPGAHRTDVPGPAFNRYLKLGSADADAEDESGGEVRSGEDGERHPSDPDQARSTKAAAVLALGVAALSTGPLIGGLVPAALAFILAREARRDLIAGRGYLTGGRQIRLGTNLAWVGIALAAAALVAAAVLGILSLAHGRLHDFPNTSN
jgi:(hydroxyamino)benzene mutase